MRTRKLSEFGIIMRKLRVDHDLTLMGVGALLKCSHSYLANIESGAKPVPLHFVKRLATALDLDAKTVDSLDAAAIKQMRFVKIELNHRSDKAKQLALMFATRFETMSETEIETHLNWLQTNTGKTICSDPNTLKPENLTSRKRLLKLKKCSTNASANTLPQSDSVQ